jgi:hypothetical protein
MSTAGEAHTSFKEFIDNAQETVIVRSCPAFGGPVNMFFPKDMSAHLSLVGAAANASYDVSTASSNDISDGIEMAKMVGADIDNATGSDLSVGFAWMSGEQKAVMSECVDVSDTENYFTGLYWSPTSGETSAEKVLQFRQVMFVVFAINFFICFLSASCQGLLIDVIVPATNDENLKKKLPGPVGGFIQGFVSDFSMELAEVQMVCCYMMVAFDTHTVSNFQPAALIIASLVFCVVGTCCAVGIGGCLSAAMDNAAPMICCGGILVAAYLGLFLLPSVGVTAYCYVFFQNIKDSSGHASHGWSLSSNQPETLETLATIGEFTIISWIFKVVYRFVMVLLKCATTKNLGEDGDKEIDDIGIEK